MRKPTHPGKILHEHYLKPKRMTLRELGKAIDEKPSDLSAFINGRTKITTGLAAKLANQFGTTELFWMNLQENYDRGNPHVINRGELIRILELIDWSDFKNQLVELLYSELNKNNFTSGS